MGKKVISQHMLIHLMGLSAFFDLFQVQNEATIGYGLWFVTAIIIMYLLLPLLRTLFRHPRGMVHLVSVVILCTVLNGIMYGTSSTWNVVVSFSVGVYLGANGRLNQLIDCDTIRSLSGSLALLGIAALATAGVLPYAMRNLLFAFYPLVFVPLIFSVAKQLPTQILAASGFFATLSYEFYILHFYFIGDNLREFLPIQSGLAAQILMSFFVTFVLAYAISRIAESLRVAVDGYLVRTNTHSSV
jgi:surface polysaccharide O-acyltransferase-like enzyme